MNRYTTLTSAVLGSLILMMAACSNEGPMERAGEELDEAVETLRNGGDSTATRVDDAADELREGVEDAVEEVRGN